MLTVRHASIFSAALIVGLLLACACSPALNWREVSSADGQFAALFPGKPQVSVREIPYEQGRIRMSMSAAGQGATLFAVGVAQLPPGSAAQALSYFEQALLTNTHMKTVTSPPLPALRPEVLARARSARALRARLETGLKAGPTQAAQPTQLVAHLLLVEDRLYQIVALGDDHLADTDLETFFGAFKLLP